MAESTAISWTDHTFNPWRGCVKVSAGCDHCYAEAQTRRWGLDLWGKDAARIRTAPAYWRKPLQWDRMAAEDGRPHLVFCASLADVMEPREDLDPIRADLWALIAATPHLVWQLLTKRPEQVPRLVPPEWMTVTGWPPNVWIGTTVEDQAAADLRVPRLAAIPAPVRFLSCEPLLGPVDLLDIAADVRACPTCQGTMRSYGPWGAGECWTCRYDPAGPGRLTLPLIDWVIVGGESGPHFRPMDPAWALSLREQARRLVRPHLFKQWGGPRAGGDHTLNGEVLQAFPPQAGDRADGGPWAARERAKAAAGTDVEIRRG